MSLKVYNTLARTKEEFLPLKEGRVGMYACGVTVYDECHLGHARAYVALDVIRRYLEYKGYQVNYIQNFTDVDDKIIARAREMREKSEEKDLKELCKEIADKYTKAYFEQMDKLAVKRATQYPRATEHIGEMIELTEGLIRKGYGYQIDGDVFFQVGKFKDYGKLSHRKLDEMRTGARVKVDERKRSPLDFALWKCSKEDEPSWDSPWGKGRPGWHIECSSMSMKYLGETFDIHAGGQDLIFPHHENEIAQSEGYTKKPFARYWLHNGFVTINQEKMSKSLGNFFTLREIFEKYDPRVVRLFLLSTHYRKPIDFSDDKLNKAKRGLERIENCLREVERKQDPSSLCPPASERTKDEGIKEKIDSDRKRFEEAMDDDFNTAAALGVIFDLVSRINSWLEKEELPSVAKAAPELRDFCQVLGLSLESPQEVRLEEELMKLIKDREEARRKKDWARADTIRVKLREEGIILRDRPQGTTWRRLE